MWMLIRLSGRLLHALSSRLQLSAAEGGAYGHFEYLTGNFCDKAEWCSMASLPSQFRGHFETEGWGPYKCEGSRGADTVAMDDVQIDCTIYGLANNHILPGRLYHPVKCDINRRGDPLVGDMALRWVLKTVTGPGPARRRRWRAAIQ